MIAPPDHLSVVAVDPGEMSGWAKLEVYGDDHELTYDELPWEACQDRLAGWTASCHARGVPAHLIMERFFIGRGTATKTRGDVHWSIEQIGVGRWLARNYGLSFDTQSPSDAKGLVSNDVLKKVGWYQATPGGHQSDAQRHLLLALMKHYPEIFARYAWV